ncbi:MAG: lysylphosphatidylglycerol synthase transmembrane domain-containing protein, partial [Anaerolineales bacterium]|nr:lysylphosphatidylglycerol synthase transmembrane domain-containing protein [Anaerolineales bacterium]
MFFALKDANWIELRKSVAAANLTWLVVAVGVVIFGLGLKVWRWSILLANFGLKNPLGLVSQAYLAGQAANILLPIRGGELVRVGMLGKGDANSLARIAGTIGVEKFLDLLALMGLTILVLPSMRSIGSHYIPQGLVLFAFAAIAFLVTYVFWAARIWSSIKNKAQRSHS